ncbi:MAG: S-methyl-5-thioribose-1-phosphate isomerase [Actinobacteria bacterium]|nr:S-methyl-5-thioribose-1-phosphate isomerase [Actinomycetota bacterium]
MIKTIYWTSNNKVRLIDQTRLPLEEVAIDCCNHHEVADAIKTMKIRGAPAIGVAAAFGVALVAVKSRASNTNELVREIDEAAEILSSTRPTAVNLFWALKRMTEVARAGSHLSVARLKSVLKDEALAIADEEREMSQAIGRHGAKLIADGDSVLTHCNAGALATVSYGTALALIRAAHAGGKRIHVYVDETRPLLQGARLTAWELTREGIPMTLICDNMAGFFMSRGLVQKVVVGADRIAPNGDVANKIGTYSVAVLAKENDIPFYVAAPVSTVDLSIEGGQDIPIEERLPGEVCEIRGRRIAPEGISVANPAFDVTPARYVTGIITDRGVVYPPYEETLSGILGKARSKT